MEPPPKKLLEQASDTIRLLHYSPRTEETRPLDQALHPDQATEISPA